MDDEPSSLPPTRENNSDLLIVGSDLDKSERRKREREASQYIIVEYNSLEISDSVDLSLRGLISVRSRTPILRFTEDWALFATIALAMEEAGHGFWCARHPRNSEEFVVLHFPNKDGTQTRVAIDSLQTCRLSHDSFNQDQSIQLLVFHSRIHYYARKASDRFSTPATFDPVVRDPEAFRDPYSRDPNAYQGRFHRDDGTSGTVYGPNDRKPYRSDNKSPYNRGKNLQSGRRTKGSG
jgi:hypothetical protein